MNRQKRLDPAASLSHSGAAFWGKLRLVAVLGVLVVWMALDYLLYRMSGMPGSGFRYWLLPPIVLIGTLMVGARFIQMAYSLERFRNAGVYLMDVLFSVSFPSILVGGGRLIVSEAEENLIYTIGGPGYVSVLPGNVVLVENLNGSVRAFGGGIHYINRLETIKEILALEDRYAKIDKLSATSRDGIEVEVRDVQFRYRLATGLSQANGTSRTTHDPYPFSEGAVVAMTYNRTVTASGVSTWHEGVSKLVESVITDYIREHLVDQLTAPKGVQDDPRGEIIKKFSSEGVVGQFRSRGAELLWIGIGHFDVPDRQVVEQHVSSWQTRWAGNAQVARAIGEAQRRAYQELGRSEAQAEILVNILTALNEIHTSGTPVEMRTLYLARIGQILDTMRSEALLPGEEHGSESE